MSGFITRYGYECLSGNGCEEIAKMLGYAFEDATIKEFQNGIVSLDPKRFPVVAVVQGDDYFEIKVSWDSCEMFPSDLNVDMGDDRKLYQLTRALIRSDPLGSSLILQNTVMDKLREM